MILRTASIRRRSFAAEARKLSTDGNYNYTSLDTLSGLITDSELPEDVRRAADSFGVDIILP